MQHQPAYAQLAFERGASAYVLKDAADTELIEAIHMAMDGGSYVHPLLAAKLASGADDDDLTGREREILRAIALGHTNQEIAGQLHLSVRTIEAHRRHVATKLRLTLAGRARALRPRARAARPRAERAAPTTPRRAATAAPPAHAREAGRRRVVPAPGSDVTSKVPPSELRPLAHLRAGRTRS